MIVDLTSMTVERTLEVDTVARKDKKIHQGAHGLALLIARNLPSS